MLKNPESLGRNGFQAPLTIEFIEVCIEGHREILEMLCSVATIAEIRL